MQIYEYDKSNRGLQLLEISRRSKSHAKMFYIHMESNYRIFSTSFFL
ncbi:MAG: hypothetical protein QW474_00835 [Candidatus Aenigmatarchaeota archaeon]